MIKTIGLIVLILVAGGLVAGIYLQVPDMIDRVDRLSDMNFDEVRSETTGLEDMNLTNLLPLMQVFMGKAVSLESIELPKATQAAVAGLNLTLPPGWEVAKDAAGDYKAYQTSTSTVVMVQDKDGNFAVISTTQVANPSAFLSTTMSKQASLLELSGFEVNAYTTTMPKGQQAKAVDVLQGDTAIQIRGWVSGNKAYLITLTSDPQDLAVTEQVFGSLS